MTEPTDNSYSNISIAMMDQDKQERLQKIRDKHVAHNQTVMSRPVLRRLAFIGALTGINERYSGHRRADRRRWARAAAKRVWPQISANRRGAKP